MFKKTDAALERKKFLAKQAIAEAQEFIDSDEVTLSAFSEACPGYDGQRTVFSDSKGNAVSIVFNVRGDRR